jgi:ankyrin repeat protein
MIQGNTSYVNKVKVNEIFKKKPKIVELTDEQKIEERDKKNKIGLEILEEKIRNKDFKINSQDEYGMTPLFLNVIKGNIDTVKYLIEKGADLEISEYENNNTPLMGAIYNSYNDVAAYLIMKGANIHAKNKNNDIPIHFAAVHGNHELVKLLYKLGADINAQNVEGHCCILYSVGNNFLELFKILIDIDINLDVMDSERKHFFDLIISKKSFKEDQSLYECKLIMQKYLHGISLFNKDYTTALMMCIMLQKNEEAIELIEKYNANYKYVYVNKMTPIHYAIKVNNVKIIEYLVEKNKNITIPSLLHYCIDNRNEYFLCLLLKNKSVLINEYNSDYICTPLVRAALTENLTMVDILLLNDADPNISGSGNYSALYFAIMSQNYEMVKLLVDNGADVNNCIRPCSSSSIHGNGPKGDSMLRYAMRCWNQDIIALLKSKNAIIQSEY